MNISSHSQTSHGLSLFKEKDRWAGRARLFHDGGRQRGPRDNYFGFTAFRGGGSGKAVPNTGDPTNFGGLGSNRVLKPGDVFSKTVGLDSWFKFKDADTYQVTASYRPEFHEPDGKTYRVIWDDFATAECSVRVEAAK
jgi:hypothetical protein